MAQTRKMRVAIGDDLFDIPTSFGNYEFVRIIGSGSFSVALLANDRSKNTQYACKVVSRTSLIQGGTFHRFEQEIRLLEMLHHPNIVPIVEVIYDAQMIYVIMEYCSGGELFQYLVDHGRLRDSELRRMFSTIVCAVAHLHSRGIAHRDLKPENILLTARLVPKIGDLGLCRQISGDALMTTPCGSPQYAAPEVLAGKGYDGRASDVWSLGVVLYVMATATMPWRSASHAGLLQEIGTAKFSVPGFVPPLLRDLIRKMIVVDPANRVTIEEVGMDPWLSKESDEFGIEMPLGVTRAASFDRRGSKGFVPKGDGTEHGRGLLKRPGIPQSSSAVQGKARKPGAAIEVLLRKVPPSGRPRPPGLQKLPN
jgi:carbon catabolite-derepressing protein kinase